MYFNLLLLQHQQPPDESRLNPMFFYVYCDISHFPELWVSRLLLLQLPAFNSEGEEVLAVLLLVADLDPRPLSNLRDLVALYHVPVNGLVVVIAEIPSQDNFCRRESSTNNCIAPNVNIKCGIILSGVLHLEMFCAFDVVQDFPLRLQLCNCNQLVGHIWNLVLLSVKEDKVAPICKRMA